MDRVCEFLSTKSSHRKKEYYKKTNGGATPATQRRCDGMGVVLSRLFKKTFQRQLLGKSKRKKKAGKSVGVREQYVFAMV